MLRSEPSRSTVPTSSPGAAGPDRGGAGPWPPVPDQDGEARSVDRRRPATARDLRGGWFDAGDTTKYVTFAMSAVHQLLTAWERHPEVFDDDAGIPESGNGRPDIVDEVMVELRWLETMQRPSGGVLTKVGWIDFDDVTPPQRDRRPRFYEEVCSSSTIAAAGMFAHGALALDGVAPPRRRPVGGPCGAGMGLVPGQPGPHRLRPPDRHLRRRRPERRRTGPFRHHGCDLSVRV